MSDKVYLPETIANEPLPVPGELTIPAGAATQPSTTPRADTAYQVPVSQVRPLPERLIAYQTISESINTQHRKILGAFTFGVLGSLQVGTYENGVSGDLRLTPNGLVARNINGETTISVDGTTGDAVFKGVLQAGTLIAGDSNVVIEGSASGGRLVFYDSSNLPSIFLGYV